MARGIIAFVVGAALLAGSGDVARAQSPAPGLKESADTKAPSGRRAARPGKTSKAARLDTLYEALAKAPNQAIAKIVESKIETLNLQSGSATADLLMVRARTMIEAK